MQYEREFVITKILVHEDLYGFENVVARIHALWNVTCDEYPDGVAVHTFVKEFPFDDGFEMDPSEWIEIDDLTTAQVEEWCVGNMTITQINELMEHLTPIIKHSHKIKQLKEYYIADSSMLAMTS